MKKVKLTLDDIQVESFFASPPLLAQGGTVHGQTGASICQTECASCVGCATELGCPTQDPFQCNTQAGPGCTGEGSQVHTCEAYCTAADCEDPTYINQTCNCADDSVPGWASCGTTCQANQTVCVCDTGTGQTGYATCTCGA